MDNYRKRVSDQILAFKLESAGAVLVEGVKWCGKTTTSEQIAKSCVYLDEIRDKVGNLVSFHGKVTAIELDANGVLGAVHVDDVAISTD